MHPSLVSAVLVSVQVSSIVYQPENFSDSREAAEKAVHGNDIIVVIGST